MQDLSERPLIRKVFRAGIAVEPIPYTAMNNWWNTLEPKVYDLMNKGDAIVIDYCSKLEALNETITIDRDAVDRLIDDGNDLSLFKDASIVAAKPAQPEPAQRSLNLSIDIGSTRYEDQSCIQILPLNHPPKVERALKVLKVDGAATLNLSTHEINPTYATFLTTFADFEAPFKTLDGLLKTGDPSANLIKVMLSSLTVLKSLELLTKTNLLSRFLTKPSLLQDIILSIPLSHPRTYSIASSLSSKPTPSSTPTTKTLDIMLKRIPNGRFSSTFLTDHSTLPANLQYRIFDSRDGPRLRHFSFQTTKSLLIVATGAEFAPVKCLLQCRIAATRAFVTLAFFEKISLFLGFRPTDIPFVKSILDEARELGLVDQLQIVESNRERKRMQDLLLREDVAGRVRGKLLGGREEGWVFVCANAGAARGTRMALKRALGSEGDDGFWEEGYLEEVF